MIARFAGADQAGWVAPDDGELQAHFTERFLTAIPAAQLISTLSGQAARSAECTATPGVAGVARRR